MKKVVIFCIFILSALQIMAQQGQKIIIIHTNDLHSRLTGFAPESAYSPLVTDNDKTVGGFARIATIIKDEKEKNEGITR